MPIVEKQRTDKKRNSKQNNKQNNNHCARNNNIEQSQRCGECFKNLALEIFKNFALTKPTILWNF